MQVKKAFTLYEMSVVLVVIGLLVASINVGSEMIRVGQMKKVIEEHQLLKTAYLNFVDVYRYKPGDINNASSYWTASECQNFDINNPCNGNGNGFIESQGEIQNAWSSLNEDIRAIQHLSLAKFIPGTYEGYDFGTTLGRLNFEVNLAGDSLDNKGNIMRSKGSKVGGYIITSIPNLANHRINNFYGEALLFGSLVNGRLSGAALPSEDMFFIDNKIDDGRPETGQIMAIRSIAQFTTTTLCFNNNSYLVTESTLSCRSLLWLENNRFR